MSDARRAAALAALFAAVLGALWFAVAAPRRDEERRLDGELSGLRRRADDLRVRRAALGAAGRATHSDRGALRRLARALPPTAAMPALLRQLDREAGRASVRLLDAELVRSTAPPPPPSATASATTTAAAAAAALPPGAVTTPTGLPGIPLRLTYDGGFEGIRRIVHRLGTHVRDRGGALSVHGRLLSIDGVLIETDVLHPGRLEATISATAYLAPGLDAAAARARRAPVADGDPFGAAADATTAVRAAARTRRPAAASSATGAARTANPTTTTAAATASATAAATPSVPRGAATPAPVKVARVDVRFSRAGSIASLRRDVARLTLLPGPGRPAALYAGLRGDGRAALFLLPPATTVSGGRCRPSRTRCTVLAVRGGSRVLIAPRGGPAYGLRVLRIGTRTLSADAARAARARRSAAGACVLRRLGVAGGDLARVAATRSWASATAACR